MRMKVAEPEMHPLPPVVPTHEQIAVRAYRHYLDRGMGSGHDVEDWLRAEGELQREFDGSRMAEAA